MRQINAKGLQIIKDSESLALKVYTCPGGKKTAGYGHVLEDDTYEGMSIGRSIAEEWLKGDVEKAEEGVNIATQHIVLNENQFSALVSLVFNIGIGNFINSTLLKKLKAGDYDGAANEFGKWVFAKGKKLNGLVIRRAKERSLFLET